MKTLFTIQGIVREGNKRGKRLRFPTMNIAVEQTVPEGVYISYAEIEGIQYKSLTFVGTAKTFDETKYQSETFVLDFDRDMYGEKITIHLLKKIRDNQKFDSEKSLREQMLKDKKEAEKFFNYNETGFPR